MADKTTDPGLMKLADKVFWEEFNQRQYPGDRYIVIDSKNQKIISQNVRLVTEKRKVRVQAQNACPQCYSTAIAGG